MALVNFYLTREAALAIFVPPYLIVIAGAPYYRRFAKNTSVKAFVQGVAEDSYAGKSCAVPRI